MKISYDNQFKKWEECINNEDKKNFSWNWIRKDNLDSWRHSRMLKPLKAFINKGDKWLTIGDGRYGTEANFLIENGIKAHASDLSDQLLKKGKEIGFINEYSQQNAEDLNFQDESFDYVLIKEALHHMPRPWIALNEAFRVSRKGVILIEPNDQIAGGFNLWKKITFFLKKLQKKRVNINDYNFEEVGNFIFTLNIREIEKFLLAMHYRNLAFIYMNDYYFKGIEDIKLNSNKIKDLFLILFLKFVIILRDIFCLIKISKPSILCVAILKDNPEKETYMKAKKCKWKIRKLPKNPYQ